MRELICHVSYCLRPANLQYDRNSKCTGDIGLMIIKI